MKRMLLALAVYYCLIDGARAQNRDLTETIVDDVGIVVLAFVGLVVLLILCTWIVFSICMCDIAVKAHKEEKRDRELLEQYYPGLRPYAPPPRYSESVDYPRSFIQSQHEIEQDIRRQNMQRQTDQTREASQWHRGPQEMQQGMLSTFQSFGMMPNQPKPGNAAGPALHHSRESEDEESDTDDSLDSNNIIDIMNMPTIPRISIQQY